MTRRLRLIDALFCQCHYEIGSSAAGDMFVCGAATVPGKSYCPDHVWRIYQRNTAIAPKPIRDRDTRAVTEREREPDLTEVLS